MMRILPLSLLFTLGLTGLAVAQEQEPPPWYQVELIVFTQPGPALDQEYWSEAIRAEIAENAIELRPAELEPRSEAVEDPLYEGGAFQLLEAETHQLPLDPNQFNRNGYRPLFHGSWRQPLLPRGESRPIRIQGGEYLAGDTRELDGEIHLDIARYLHLRTGLFFTQPIPENWQSPLLPPISATLPAPTTPATGLSTLGLTRVEPAPRLLSVKLQQARRLRGDEIHYLDHPLFGLIIRLTPWTPPEPEVAADMPAMPIPVESPVLSAQPPQ